MNKSLTAHHSFIRDLPGWRLLQRVRARLAEHEVKSLLECRKVADWNVQVARRELEARELELRKVDVAIRENDAKAKTARMRAR